MSALTVTLAKIRGVAMKHPGMWQDFEAAGEVRGDQLVIEREAFEAINIKYFPGIRAGAVLHSLLNPVAIVADAVLGTNLGDCGGCAERELAANAAVSELLSRLTGANRQ